jgi:hypothetical protein
MTAFEHALHVFSRPVDPEVEMGAQQVGGWVGGGTIRGRGSGVLALKMQAGSCCSPACLPEQLMTAPWMCLLSAGGCTEDASVH